MAREERSAGFLIFHRRARDDAVRYLLLDYGRHWDFAKGHVDPGETDIEAAIRELREETGIRDLVPVPDFEREIVYFFRSARHGLIRKTVVFFLVVPDLLRCRLAVDLRIGRIGKLIQQKVARVFRRHLVRELDRSVESLHGRSHDQLSSK